MGAPLEFYKQLKKINDQYNAYLTKHFDKIVRTYPNMDSSHDRQPYLVVCCSSKLSDQDEKLIREIASVKVEFKVTGEIEAQ
jgi:hypothetical protein